MSSFPRRYTRSRYWPPDPHNLLSYRETYAITIKDFEDNGPLDMFQQFVRFNVQQVYMPPTNMTFAFVRFLTRSDAEEALHFCRGKYDASFYKYDPQKRYIKPLASVQQVKQEKQVPEPQLKKVVDLPVRENKHVEDSKPKRKGQEFIMPSQ
ncbi:hypothetical protein MKW92_049952 [Papaver armeniacum]|nr:hypothetical protein MKW92_049952 [Papaver armeniacum]